MKSKESHLTLSCGNARGIWYNVVHAYSCMQHLSDGTLQVCTEIPGVQPQVDNPLLKVSISMANGNSTVLASAESLDIKGSDLAGSDLRV